MKYKTFFGVLFLLGVLISPLTVTEAADLGSVHIDGVRLTQDDRDLKTAFSIKNISKKEQTVTYGIRIQSIATGNAQEVPVGSVTLPIGGSKILYTETSVGSDAQGAHDVFILSRDAQGTVNILKYAGVIQVEAIQESGVVESKLSDCSYNNSRVIRCSVSNAGEGPIGVVYAVYKGSAYGELITNGTQRVLPINGSSIDLSISEEVSEAGDYTYRLWLSNKADAQQVLVQIPGAKVVQVEVADNGQLQPVEQDASSDTLTVSVIILLGILLLGIVLVVMRNKKGTASLIILMSLVSVGVASASITLIDTQVLAHIFNGFSRDSGQVQYSVTLDSTTFNAGDPIGFSLVFQETALPNNKPSGGSIDLQVDGGSWQSMVTSSNTGTIYHKTIAAIGSAGVHTLNFSSPDLCGGAFGASLFDGGIFGTTDCVFSMPITIEQNNPPTVPTVRGDCLLGVSCSIGLLSTDTDGGELCYEAKWPDDSTQNAGCATEGTTVSISHIFNSCSIADTTVRAQATDENSLISGWGVGAPNINNTITCTEPCTHCTYNGVTGDVGIIATPSFLSASGTVEVSWNLTNVTTCSVEGIEVDTGIVVDSWDWDTVRLNQSQQSSLLSGTTKFTIDCTDLDGGAKDATVVVGRVPAWQEF